MSVFAALLSRVWPRWPNWTCQAIDASNGLLCNRPATCWADPVPGAAHKWTYCAAHAPEHAEPIPPDAKYWVIRLELKVAVCCPPGGKTAATDAGIRRLAYAVEDAGGIITSLRVPRGTASRAPVERPTARIELAGLPRPAGEEAPRLEAPARSSPLPWRAKRRGSR